MILRGLEFNTNDRNQAIGSRERKIGEIGGCDRGDVFRKIDLNLAQTEGLGIGQRWRRRVRNHGQSGRITGNAAGGAIGEI